ncbi:deacetylase [Lithospermum erythrorhizon]|uniref:Deacetylase n=1 Tax=Lithospermum erythrorhizon TaxID=34254 RepID=A0AAV3PM32_LITER
MASEDNELIFAFPEFKVYKNGKFERGPTPTVPACMEDQETGVSSKDVSISSKFSARMYLPKLKSKDEKLRILIYIHGGGYCVGSAFQPEVHRYMNILASQAHCVGVSVEYRLAPEHPMPASYEDSWNAVQWVASHADNKSKIEKEPWLANHGDFSKVFINGDSAGGNIVHAMVMKAGDEKLPGDVKLLGAIYAFPYFWSSEIEEKVKTNDAPTFYYNLWKLVYPSAPGGIDCPLLNPWAKNAPSLTVLGCSKILVVVGSKDPLKVGAVKYLEEVKKSGWKGKTDFLDIEGEDHCFQLVNLDLEKSKIVVKRMVDFIRQ